MLEKNNHLKTMQRLALTAAALAIIVVMLGAYTRLKDAGLGCPDWPGCYGSLIVPDEHHEIIAAEKAFPERPVEAEKAWAEMTHRYFASTLGLLILIMAFFAWRKKQQDNDFPVVLPYALLVLVIFQGMLGMWTVTMKLNPVIVMSHLLGGMTTFSLLITLTVLIYYVRNMRTSAPIEIKVSEALAWKNFAFISLLVLILQIALGGWTSANYAALVCQDFPFCQGDWIQHLKPAEAFQLWGHGVENYEFGVKSIDARTTIHVAHRMWSVVTLFTLLTLGFRLIKSQGILHKVALVLLLLVSLQFLLGMANVEFNLPLANAVAHNGVGALLLATLVTLNILLLHVRRQNRGQKNEE